MYTDDETGLVYYGYRYYSQMLGRWISRDRMEGTTAHLLYCFVLNRPTMLIDGDGREIIDVNAGDFNEAECQEWMRSDRREIDRAIEMFVDEMEEDECVECFRIVDRDWTARYNEEVTGRGLRACICKRGVMPIGSDSSGRSLYRYKIEEAYSEGTLTKTCSYRYKFKIDCSNGLHMDEDWHQSRTYTSQLGSLFGTWREYTVTGNADYTPPCADAPVYLRVIDPSYDRL